MQHNSMLLQSLQSMTMLLNKSLTQTRLPVTLCRSYQSHKPQTYVSGILLRYSQHMWYQPSHWSLQTQLMILRRLHLPVWSTILAKSGHYLDLSQFKSTCSKARKGRIWEGRDYHLQLTLWKLASLHCVSHLVQSNFG